MARVKGGNVRKNRRKRLRRWAKGFRGRRKNVFRVMKQSVMRALQSAYIGRKQRKREFRRLWISRINAACRKENISYSRFIFGLKKANIELNRKMLAELAVNNYESFKKLVELARKSVEGVA